MLPVISPAETHRKLEAGTIRLIDIREPDEIAALRAPGSEPAPLSVIRWMHLPQADKDKAIVFTCQSGRRLQRATAKR